MFGWWSLICFLEAAELMRPGPKKRNDEVFRTNHQTQTNDGLDIGRDRDETEWHGVERDEASWC